MTKKDLIIIAVLANLGVLAVLFMLAIRMDEPPEQDQGAVNYVIQEMLPEPQVTSLPLNIATQQPADEMDVFLSKNGPTENSSAFTVDEEFPLLDQDSSQASSESSDDSKDDARLEPPQFVEITVKRGDALEKIARANGTTVEAIKKANHLSTDRLKIGQVLQVPVGGPVKEISPPVKSGAVHSTPNDSSEQYYTIKSGDNPWKIAKQFNIKVYELLKLNDLDEDKARNLKIGDQIRVR